MAWTDPPDWASGAILTSAQLDQYLTANLNYLKAFVDRLDFVGVQAYRSSNQSIATGTNEYITFTAELWDYGTWFTPSSTTITVPAAAIPTGYTTIPLAIFAKATFEANTTGVRRVAIHQNGSEASSQTIGGTSAFDHTIQCNAFFGNAAAGDTLKLQVHQTSGGALNVTEARMTVVRFGFNA